MNKRRRRRRSAFGSDFPRSILIRLFKIRDVSIILVWYVHLSVNEAPPGDDSVQRYHDDIYIDGLQNGPFCCSFGIRRASHIRRYWFSIWRLFFVVDIEQHEKVLSSEISRNMSWIQLEIGQDGKPIFWFLLLEMIDQLFISLSFRSHQIAAAHSISEYVEHTVHR